MDDPPPVAEHIARANAAAVERLPFADERDFEDARRGLVAPLTPGVVRNDEGEAIWDLDSYGFLEGEAPESAHPSLWRIGRLNTIAGLFEIAPGFFQLRGFDLSNMEIIEGATGVIVVDPLISAEAAAAGLALYRQHRGERPVSAVVYTHSHVDHFGGVRGVVDEELVRSGRVAIVAPAGFLEYAIAENAHVGTAMARRAGYMYGALLERGPRGQLGCGLGMTTSTGRVSLLAPTVEVVETGQEEVIDGVRFVFQLTPGTEAPAEMNFHFPDHRVLCIAENATRTMHNLLTLRGALVRDPRVWARYLDEAIELFAADTDVLFAVHHWPITGSARIVEFLTEQRDLYGYLHDQTVRLINRGLSGPEIAEELSLPPELERAWHCRGYYGSVSHNVKAIYQRYMGWFDGNPAHLWEHPPVERARRYVTAIGGLEAVLEQGRGALAEGDLRWAAELVNHAVFAEPASEEARELQARILEQLGWGAENGTWRNFFLMGARELREGALGTPTTPTSPDMVSQLSLEQVVDGIAVRIDGPRAFGLELRLNFEIADTGEVRALTLRNAVLSHRPKRDPQADATVRFERAALDELIARSSVPADLFSAGRITVEGDGQKLGQLLGLIEEPDPSFPIVTP